MVISMSTLNGLTELAAEIHEDNKLKGFYDEETRLFKEGLLQDAVTGGYLQQTDLDFIENAVKNQKLMLIVTELAEATEATRMTSKGYADSAVTASYLKQYKDGEMDADTYASMYKMATKDRLQAEIAGTFIRLMDFCGRYNIDISTFVEAELEYNKTRPYKHAKTC